MRPRIALVRGPNLNSWELQNFTPLLDRCELVGFASTLHNFDLRAVGVPVRYFPSLGQTARARSLRQVLVRRLGSYHDLLGLERGLKGFQIVHTAETSTRFSFQAARAKSRHGFRLVVTVWENIPFLADAPATRRLKRRVFEDADLLLAVTERARQVLLLEGAPPERVKVLMPGIDLSHFTPRPRDPGFLERLGCFPDDRIVLFVAHLTFQKGVYDLLFAFAEIVRSGRGRQPWRLLFAGKGPEERRLRDLVTHLDLSDHVRFIGSHPYDRMPEVHALADVFVLPSRPVQGWQEQFGYVLAESMACGKPVISTVSGSIPEVVGDAGVLVPPADHLALAGALHRMLSAPDENAALGARARERAERLFDSTVVAEALWTHYSGLLAR